METLLITQARFGSSRFPGKVMEKINGDELLKIHIKRVEKSKLISSFVVATTLEDQDDVIFNSVKSWGYNSYRGSEEDVLDRFYQTAKKHLPKWVIRVTSDCPLIDPKLIDEVIKHAIENDVDYCSNILVENYPDGQDIEVFKFSALEKAWKESTKKSDREHVTLYIRDNCDFNQGNIFKSSNYPCKANFSKVRMTVDEKADYKVIKILIDALGKEKTWEEYTSYILENDLSQINGEIIRNEGLLKSLKKD